MSSESGSSATLGVSTCVQLILDAKTAVEQLHKLMMAQLPTARNSKMFRWIKVAIPVPVKTKLQHGVVLLTYIMLKATVAPRVCERRTVQY